VTVASIFKREAAKRNKLAVWYIAYTDHEGRRRTVKGFRDKGLTEQLAAKLENEAMLKKRGLVDPEAERLATQRQRPLEEHLADFEKHLRAKGRTPKYLKLILTRIRRVVKECEFRTAADLDRGEAEQQLASERGGVSMGNKTFNHYASALNTFGRWLHVDGRVSRNPFLGIIRVNAAEDVRHERRALSAEEIGRLVASARRSGRKVQNYDGETRARAYLLAYLTGLRCREMGSLTPAHFDLGSVPPTLTLEAAHSKHRRVDVLPLHPELVALLRSWLMGLNRDDFLFPRFARKKAWLMVKKDLEGTGIPYIDESGRVADFHSAGRHSYITGLIKSGASVTEARELARHTDIRMTMRYTHIGIGDQAAALAGLPLPDTSEKPSPPLNAPSPATNSPGSGIAQRISSALEVSGGPTLSQDDESRDGSGSLENDETPEGSGVCVSLSPEVSRDVSEGEKWRRRESNPRPEVPKRPLLHA
jgi:integrase